MRQPVDFKTNNNGWGFLQDAGYVFHPGFDYNYGSGYDDKGMPVYAVADGEVVSVDSSGANGGWGEHVYIKHNISGIGVVYSHYAHMQNVSVVFGQRISEGEKIGEISNTGSSTMSPHLHFEIMTNEMYEYYVKRYGHEYYPTKRNGWPKQDVEDMYYNPIEFINNNLTMEDETLKGYMKNLKEDLKYVESEHDVNDTFTCGEIAKIVSLAHTRMMTEIASLKQQIDNINK